MAAVTLLGTATLTTTAGTKTVTATPAVGDLIVIVVAHTGQVSYGAPTDDNADGLGTYTLAGTAALKATSADKLSIYVRDALIGSATSTIFTSTAAGSSGGGLVVHKVTGMVRVSAGAVRQYAKQDNQAAATPAPVFGGASLTGNPKIGAVFNATSPATMTPPAGFTETADAGYSTPTTGLETAAVNSGNTVTTVTWGSASASAFCAAVVELDTTVPTFTLSGSGALARPSGTGAGLTVVNPMYTLSGTGSPARASGTGAGLHVTPPIYTLSGSGALARPSGTGAGLTFTGGVATFTLSGSGALARAAGTGTGLHVTAPVYTLSGTGSPARPSSTGTGLHVTAPVYTVSGSGALARPSGAGTGLHITNPTYTLSGTGSPARPSGTGAGLLYIAPGAVVLSGSGALARGSSSGTGLHVTAPVYTLTGSGALSGLASSGAGLTVSAPAAVYTLSGEGRLARPSALTGNEGRPTSAGGAAFVAAGGRADLVAAGGGARWR